MALFSRILQIILPPAPIGVPQPPIRPRPVPRPTPTSAGVPPPTPGSTTGPDANSPTPPEPPAPDSPLPPSTNDLHFLKGDGREGCIAPDGTKNGSKVILKDCSDPDHMWRMDDNGMFHSSMDENVCLQATNSGELVDGAYLRVYECDMDQDLQMFSIDEAQFSPMVDMDLCIVSRGTHQDVNIDPIILKTCGSVSSYRLGWIMN